MIGRNECPVCGSRSHPRATELKSPLRAPEIRFKTTKRFVEGDWKESSVPVAVFDFTLVQLQWLEKLVPHKDGFHADILDAIEELDKRQKFI